MTTRSFRKHSRERVEKLLKLNQRKTFNPKHGWESDLGRKLINYRRVHTFLLNEFGRKGLAGKRIIQLGAGNGTYLDFLRKNYGAKTVAIEKESTYIEEMQKSKVQPGYVQADAQHLPIKPNSADVIISDHFLFATYIDISDKIVLHEAKRVLKPGGLLVMERVNDYTKRILEKEGFELVHEQEKENENDLWSKMEVFRKKVQKGPTVVSLLRKAFT